MLFLRRTKTYMKIKINHGGRSNCVVMSRLTLVKHATGCPSDVTGVCGSTEFSEN